MMCAFCDAAKTLLNKNNLKFKEINVATNPDKRDEMLKNLIMQEQYHKFF